MPLDAQALRATRLRLGLTQVQFAQLFGLQGSTIARWENSQDDLWPTPFHLGLIELLDQAGRRRPRRRAGNDIVETIVTRGAARALAELLAEALKAPP